MYFVEASISVEPVAGNANYEIELVINTVTVETFICDTARADAGLDPSVYHFLVGYKVESGDEIKLNCVANDSCKIRGFIQCFEKTTGETLVI